MGKAARASLLILLLACSAQAGLIPNDTPAPPPPPQPCVAQEGIMPNESHVEEPTASGVLGRETEISLTQVALELFAVLPSLL